MLYGLEQGPYEKGILEQAIRHKMPIPEKIKNAPELYEGLDLFYLAFMDLNSCRALGYGVVGPIDWLTINTYCDVHGLEGEQREDMFFFLNKMDAEYQRFNTEKNKPVERPSPRKR